MRTHRWAKITCLALTVTASLAFTTAGEASAVGAFNAQNPAASASPSASEASGHATSVPHFSGKVGTTAAAPTPDGKGFWTVTAGGAVSVQGDAVSYGDPSQTSQNGSIVSIAPTIDGRGYWLLGSDGGVFSYGDASFYGSTGNLHLNAPALQMVSTADSRGYWFVAADGGIFSFGDAQFHGSTGNIHLNQRVVGMARTSQGGGYWLVAADGGIFSFGDAQFHGSTGSIRLNMPVVSMASTADGGGYWLVASDGGIFTFGDARFFGSAAGSASSGSVVSMVATGDGGGYWIIANDGNIYSYGDAATTGGGSPPPTALSNEYLGETNPLDTSPSWGNTTDSTHSVNGTAYTQSIDTWHSQGGNCQGCTMYVDYNLGRIYSTLHTTIGLDDNWPNTQNATVRFQVFGDGVLLYTNDVTVGHNYALSVNVSQVLHMRLQVIELPLTSATDHYPGFDAVFGSAYVSP